MGNDNSLSQDSQTRVYRDFFDSGTVLGRGTFAVVKRCTRKKDSEKFAVKIVDKKSLTMREINGLKQEIKILANTNHRNVIAMVDVFDTKTHVKMVLELCTGGDLMDLLLEQPHKHFDEEKASEYTVKLAYAISYLHDHYVVHRDLKPENILLTKNRELKITDFGLSHYMKISKDYHSMHTCCGTPHYVAPEVLAQKSYGYEVDYWSLGVITYIMLSGIQPFNSHSINKMYNKIMCGKYSFPSPYFDKVSDSAKRFVRCLMEVDRYKRYKLKHVINDKWVLQFKRNQKYIKNYNEEAMQNSKKTIKAPKQKRQNMSVDKIKNNNKDSDNDISMTSNNNEEIFSNIKSKSTTESMDVDTNE